MVRAVGALIISALVTVAGAGSAALAAESDANECAHGKSLEVRLRACSDVIDTGAATPDARAEAYRMRAWAFSEKADHKRAIADFSAAIALKTDDAASYFGRGQLRLAEGDLAGAVADLTEAIRYDGPSTKLLTTLGYAHLVKGDAAEAVADFSAALQLDPKNAAALNTRGLAYRKTGDLDKAIADYTAALQLNPIYALAYNNRGYAYEARGDKRAAADDFRRALLIDPALAGARDGLKRLGEPPAAMSESEGLIAEGKLIAQKQCAWCHAIEAEEESPNRRAPRWRDLSKRYPILALREPLTRGIGRPHDEMPKFELSDADIDKIVAYINSLSP